MQIAWHPETLRKRWGNDELGQNGAANRIGPWDLCVLSGWRPGGPWHSSLPTGQRGFQTISEHSLFTLWSLFVAFFTFLHLSSSFRSPQGISAGFQTPWRPPFCAFFVNIWTQEPNRHIDTTAQTRRSPKLSLNPNLLRFCQSQTNLINFDTHIADIDTNWYQLCQNYCQYWYCYCMLLLLLLLIKLNVEKFCQKSLQAMVDGMRRSAVALVFVTRSSPVWHMDAWYDAKKWHINSYYASSYGMQCSSLAFGGCGYGGHS